MFTTNLHILKFNVASQLLELYCRPANRGRLLVLLLNRPHPLVTSPTGNFCFESKCSQSAVPPNFQATLLICFSRYRPTVSKNLSCPCTCKSFETKMHHSTYNIMLLNRHLPSTSFNLPLPPTN